jgi:hypothetical protein
MLVMATNTIAAAQDQRAVQTGPAAEIPRTLKAAAPVDLTGTWVSVVTEDWRWRMMTPPRGDYAAVPLTAAGRQTADAWDPAADDASGQQCKAYGAAGLMRMPGRLHITWADDDTLKIEFDAGTQTRLLKFPPPSVTGEKTWQGVSSAMWELPQSSTPGEDGEGARGTRKKSGALKVVTTSMRGGYLRKNGVPYSDNAVMTEYFVRTTEHNGDEWLVVTTIVDDPRNLTEPFVTSTHFKKEADTSKFSPAPCVVPREQ